MKKKSIEKLAERRKIHTEGLENLLAKRKREIEELKGEIEGYKQLTAILEAFILGGISKTGVMEIPKAVISEGLKGGFEIEVTEDKYILRKKNS